MGSTDTHVPNGDPIRALADIPSGLETDSEAWSVLEDFASVIGHEIRIPLAVVKGAAETALWHADALDKEGLEVLLETIVRNSGLALLLVDRIGLARDIEDGSVTLELEQVDIATLVAESVSDLKQVVLSEHPVEVTGEGSLPVDGDPTALREIVFNVLSNAAKYSGPGAPIEVTVHAGGGNAEVVVRNHGTGVTPGDSQTIFDKFVQGDPGAPGAGLGLYISRGLARAHGGDLRVQPADTTGSEFVLTVPRRAPVS